MGFAVVPVMECALIVYPHL